MTDLRREIAKEHCRVIVPTDNDPFSSFEYCRHLFPYHVVAQMLPHNVHLLEVGFGSGYGAGFLSESIEHVTAIDIAEDAVTYASALYQKVHFRLASGTSLPFEDNSFDYVVSYQVLEHIPNSILFLREIFRVLRPGGGVYLTTPNRRLRLFPFQRPWNRYHVREYSDRSLLKEVKSVFPNAHLKGVMANKDLMELEKRRVSPWRYFRRRINRLLSYLIHMSADIHKKPMSGTISLEDFFLTSNQTAECLDLLCSAIKAESDG
jgi:ubiquinone/menaquinone biosynthesis C-methylase UbiE